MRVVWWMAWLLVACSSEDAGEGELSATAACTRKFDVLCERAFACLTPDELESAADTLGSSRADCPGQFSQYCTPEMVACGADQSYQPEMGRACVAAYEAFSCEDVRGYVIGTTTPEPAACDQVCTP